MKSFNQQLFRVVLLVSSLALILSSLAFFLVETHFSRKADIAHLFPLAETLGINLKPFLGRNDSFRSREVLATLAADPNIHSAYLFKADDEPLTNYRRTKGTETFYRADVANFLNEDRVRPILHSGERQVISSGGYLAVFTPVMHEGRKLGTICLVTHLSHLNQRLFVWGLLAVAICGAALGFGVILAHRLSSSISAPVHRLADKMQRVATQHDFSVVIEDKPVNEIELLVQGFNEMLVRLSLHEQELSAVNATLEQRIATRTEELRNLLTEKDLLLREVHHRVKNNLQVIASLLTLQIKNCKDPAVAPLLTPSLSRIRSISLIHEKLYATEISTTLEVGTYLTSLAKETFRMQAQSGDHIQLRLDFQESYASLDFTINLALILNELLSNSLKHAFTETREGSISVQQTRTSLGLTLSVTDDGCGLPEGFPEGLPSTLGLRLVRGLSEQLRGSFSLTRLPRGTCASVTCPLPVPADNGVKGTLNEPI